MDFHLRKEAADLTVLYRVNQGSSFVISSSRCGTYQRDHCNPGQNGDRYCHKSGSSRLTDTKVSLHYLSEITMTEVHKTPHANQHTRSHAEHAQ